MEMLFLSFKKYLLIYLSVNISVNLSNQSSSILTKIREVKSILEERLLQLKEFQILLMSTLHQILKFS